MNELPPPAQPTKQFVEGTEIEWTFDQPPRDTQVSALQWISGEVKALKESDPTKRPVLILEAPCGVGKSRLTSSIATWQRGIVVTPTIQLQEQYQAEIQEMRLLKGAQNYICNNRGTTQGEIRNCKTGKTACKKIDKDMAFCPYVIARNQFLNSRIGLTNYAFLLNYLKAQHPPHSWLLFDEFHHLPTALADVSTIFVRSQVTKCWGEEPGLPRTEEEAYALLRLHLPKATAIVELLSLQEETSDTPLDQAAATTLDRCSTFVHQANTILESIEEGDDWVLDLEYEDDQQEYYAGFRLKPLGIQFAFKGLQKQYNLFMTSATVLDSQLMAGWLGLEHHSSMVLDSPFEVSNRPVYYAPVGKMSKEMMADTLPKMITALARLLDNQFNGMRGVIHTHSFALAAKIFAGLKSLGYIDRLVLHVPNDNAASVTMRHQMTPAGVLISPSATEGIDLKGDKGRFSVIAKVPYPYLGDSWVRRRKQVDPDWYDWTIAKTIVQACGRVVRSNDDWGVSIILDENFKTFYERSRRFFPPWWRKSLTVA
jgi:Rad3-related DNA helicase